MLSTVNSICLANSLVNIRSMSELIGKLWRQANSEEILKRAQLIHVNEVDGG